jgi:hydroxymethylbilane synthase
MAGNVDTRLQRLEEGRADALILASAGLDRLGRGSVITRRLEPDEMLGAPAQGALGIGCREDDEETRISLLKMEDPIARATASVERDLLQFLRGGCRAPVGASATLLGDHLVLQARVLSLDGRECLEDELSEPFALPSPSSPSKKSPSSSSVPPSSLGRLLAERLLARGAARLIDASRESA